MSGKLKGSSLAGFSTDRAENDFYATDPNSVKLFLDTHKLEGKTFYEPCCGDGSLAKVVEEYFPEAHHFATDLVYRGYGYYKSVDFLNSKQETVDWIITNPPYKLAKQFIERSLEITNVGVAMFLKIQFLEGVNRKEFLKNTPLKYVYVHSSRQNPMKNGIKVKGQSSTMCFCWFVWEHGYNAEPIIRWI